MQRLRERNAAKFGMTLEQYDAHVAAEQRRLDAIYKARTDHHYCRGVLISAAISRGNVLAWSTP